MIVALLIIIAMGIGISIVKWSLLNGISPMPTSIKAKKTLMDSLPSDVTGTIYELGAGWGTLAFALARRYPRSQVIAYETSPIPYYFCRGVQWILRIQNLTVIRKDFWNISLSGAAMVVCYLYPGAMHRLSQKFKDELAPKTLIISNTFALSGWTPEKVFIVNDLYRTKNYHYFIE